MNTRLICLFYYIFYFKFSFTTLLSRSLKILLFLVKSISTVPNLSVFQFTIRLLSYTSIGGMNDSSNSVPVVRFMRNNL